MQKIQELTDPLRTERKRNSDFGMPEIDDETETVVSYILTRLLGAIPSFQYTTSEDALNSICAEYCYALMRHKVKDMAVINRAIDHIVDLGEKFLPPAGQLASICKDIMRSDERRKSAQEHRKYMENEEAAEALDKKITEEARKRLKDRGVLLYEKEGITISERFEKNKQWLLELKKEEDLIRNNQ